ncbi:hypothetical protein V496_09261 [Pseudogymnoascus sp. VKM F-4515 (FW-2607)]|nr:hypothetical protein V496_09261 [Pseudogymnoascus sp. VKM F-4515 (FW-2607)]
MTMPMTMTIKKVTMSQKFTKVTKVTEVSKVTSHVRRYKSGKRNGGGVKETKETEEETERRQKEYAAPAIRQVLVNIRRLRQITVQDTPKLGGSQVSKVKPAKYPTITWRGIFPLLFPSSDEEFPLVCHKCQGSAENLVEAACTVSTVLSYLTDAPLLRPYNPYSGITTLSPPVANFLFPPTNHRLPTTTATL